MPDANGAAQPPAEPVGEATYRSVKELTSRKTNTLTRAQAFAQLAEEQERKESTVSANYYRVARKRGEGRSQRAATPRRARLDTSAPSPLLEAIARAQAALAAVEAVAQQDLEVRRQLKSLL